MSEFSFKSLVWTIVFVFAVAWAWVRFDRLNERLITVSQDLNEVLEGTRRAKDDLREVNAVRAEGQRALKQAQTTIQSLAGDLSVLTDRLSQSEADRIALQDALTEAERKASARAEELEQTEAARRSDQAVLLAAQSSAKALEEKLDAVEAARREAIRKIAQIETARAVAEFAAFTVEEELERVKAELSASQAAKVDAEGKASACEVELEAALTSHTSAQTALSEPEEKLRPESHEIFPTERAPAAGASPMILTPERRASPAL